MFVCVSECEYSLLIVVANGLDGGAMSGFGLGGKPSADKISANPFGVVPGTSPGGSMIQVQSDLMHNCNVMVYL